MCGLLVYSKFGFGSSNPSARWLAATNFLPWFKNGKYRARDHLLVTSVDPYSEFLDDLHVCVPGNHGLWILVNNLFASVPGIRAHICIVALEQPHEEKCPAD
jgi:hypothetical protein